MIIVEAYPHSIGGCSFPWVYVDYRGGMLSTVGMLRAIGRYHDT